MTTKKILLITSAQPSANPRMVKEAISLVKEGYLVSVIWCPLSPWADSFDHELFQKYPNIKWIKTGYHFKKQPLGYLYARIRKKYWKFIYRLIGNRFDAAIKSLVLYSQELKSAAVEVESDIFIGHNLGALPAIVSASKKFNAKNIFDFEDFHRGEYSVDALEYKMIIDVESNYISHVNSITTANSSITEAYGYIFPQKNITTINNVFPLSYSIEQIKEIPAKPLKLFWFSQYIGKKRGLENIIQAMASFDQDDIQLTLLGSCSNKTKNYFSSWAESIGLIKKQLIFMCPVSESKLVDIASEQHIGLASEPGRDLNNEMALSNKIMIFLLAGNAIVTSKTKAQKNFLNTYPGIGLLYEKESTADLERVLSTYMENRELLDQHRVASLQLAKTELNWEIESVKWLKLINQHTDKRT